jgi:2-isopropylmalate synthase
LLVNLHLLGWRHFDLRQLPEYVQNAAKALGFEIPAHQPVVGRDAFRTATGAHAAAVSKALALGDPWVADHVFSGVPAQLLGRDQQLEVGPASGEANVVAWLTERGIEPEARMVGALLARAKRADAILPERELLELVPGAARPASK